MERGIEQAIRERRLARDLVRRFVIFAPEEERSVNETRRDASGTLVGDVWVLAMRLYVKRDAPSWIFTLLDGQVYRYVPSRTDNYPTSENCRRQAQEYAANQIFMSAKECKDVQLSLPL